MDLTAEQIAVLLAQPFPTHLRDLMVTQLTTNAMPHDEVLVIYEGEPWGGEPLGDLGRTGLSMTVATARHLRDQLSLVLDRVDQEAGR